MRLLNLIVGLFLLVSCQNQEEIGLSVTSKDNQQQIVSNARVFINGKFIGMTDDKGIFVEKIQIEDEKMLRFEVMKSSDEDYFAPYYETVQLQSSTQNIDLEAILYSVPKVSSEEKEGGSVSEVDLESEVSNEEFITEEVSQEELVVEEGALNPGIDALNIKQKDTVNVSPSISNLVQEKAPAKADFLKKKDRKKISFTIQAASKGKPLSGVNVRVGDPALGELKDACRTNIRGRCVAKFDHLSSHSLRVVADRVGFKTLSLNVKIKDKQTIRLKLRKGYSLDIFALQKSYNFIRGLKGVHVEVDGKLLGDTDAFGHFSYVYQGVKDNLIEVSLRSNKYNPKIFKTDFLTSNHMSLTRYFSSKKATPVRTVLLPVQIAGKLKYFDGHMQTFSSNLISIYNKSFNQHASLTPYSYNLFEKKIALLPETLEQIQSKGWLKSDLKGLFDALIIPTLILNENKIELELTFLNALGKVVAASKVNLDSLEEKNTIEKTMDSLLASIGNIYPFEGSIVKKVGDHLHLNLGLDSNLRLKAGDVFQIWGTELSIDGFKRQHKKIGKAKILKVFKNYSLAKMINKTTLGVVNLGDKAVFAGRSLLKKQNISKSNPIIFVHDEGKKGLQGIHRANVYFEDKWLGSTDKRGKLFLPYKIKGAIKIVKNGYATKIFNLKNNKNSNFKIKMKREFAYLKIDSLPSGAKLFVDDTYIGKTPLSSHLAIPSGFIKIELKGLSGYKAKTRVLDVENGTLELTGERKFLLEKDLLAGARKTLQEGRIQEAIGQFISIPEEHSDYLRANHEVGDIYLTILDKPSLAAGAFARVTKRPEVQSFQEKEFIGSHINEGIALFHTAEKIVSVDSKIALAHYKKAFDVLEKVRPHVRSIRSEQYEAAFQSVMYHRGLCLHKIWYHSKEKALLRRVISAWNQYVDLNDQMIRVESSFLEHAEVLLKQAKSFEKKYHKNI